MCFAEIPRLNTRRRGFTTIDLLTNFLFHFFHASSIRVGRFHVLGDAPFHHARLPLVRCDCDDLSTFITTVCIFLHCRLLRSVSWFNHHKRKACFEQSPRSVALFLAKFDHYVRDIETEVELLHETGRLFFGDSQRLCDRPIDQTPQLLAIPGEVEDGLPLRRRRVSF